jgi:hypothetical protein
MLENIHEILLLVGDIYAMAKLYQEFKKSKDQKK